MTFNIDSEKKFWNWLRDKLPGHVVRIENSVGHGLPDVNMCGERGEMWLELKCGTTIMLRKGQYAWGMKRAKFGGNVFVINYCPVHDTVAIYRYPLTIEKAGEYLKVTSDPEWCYPRANISRIIL